MQTLDEALYDPHPRGQVEGPIEWPVIVVYGKVRLVTIEDLLFID